MSRIYIAGPMTGIPEHNFPAFHAAAKIWRGLGWTVLNPAESFEGRTDLPYREYVKHDIEMLRTCDAIAMLPGWDAPGSRGSVWEREVATMLGLPAFPAGLPVFPAVVGVPDTVLDEARRLVHGPRGKDYGHPAKDFGRTAGMATALLRDKLKEGASLSRQDVAMFMILVKLSRLANRFKRDSVVDIAGYAETAAMCDEWERENHGA